MDFKIKMSVLSSSCGKLKLKLPSWKVICRLNLSYPVLVWLMFFQSFKNRSFYLDSVYFYSRSFICSYWPGENTVFCILVFMAGSAETVFLNLNENKLLFWSEEPGLSKHRSEGLFSFWRVTKLHFSMNIYVHR